MEAVVSSRKPFGIAGQFSGNKKEKEGLVKLYRRRDIVFIKDKDINSKSPFN